MITLTEFLNCLEENVSRITHYESAGDGSGGGCDCIGLIIGALRLAGFKWPGTHGSNWAARNAMDGLEHIADPGKLFLGEIVFKAHEPGEKGYDLPGAYKNSPDQRDYYHVGVVTGTAPLVITHCTSVPGGIQRDNRLGAWKWGGKLKYVDYQGGDANMEEPLYRATVTAESGKTVRMRTGPSTNAWVEEEVPIGTEVEVLDVLNGWCKIRLENGKTGYMMGKFLRELGGNEEPAAGDLISRSALLAAYDASHEGPPGNARRLIEDAPAVEDMVPKAEYEALAQRLKKIAFALME